MSDSQSTPLAAALDSVGDRWTLLLVEALLDGPRRFGDLQEQVPRIAPNVLTQRLRRLESEGLVLAQPYSERPQRYVYEAHRAGARARRRAPPARRLGRPPSGVGGAAAPRCVRHSGGGALVVPDVREARRRRPCRRPSFRINALQRDALVTLDTFGRVDDQPTRVLDPGRPPGRPPEDVYKRRRLVAAAAGGIVLLILIVAIASSGGDDPEPAGTPSDLGVGGSPTLQEPDTDRDRTTTSTTPDDDGTAVTPVAPTTPPADGTGAVPAPAPAPPAGEGGGVGQAPPPAPAPPEGEGGGAAAPPGD